MQTFPIQKKYQTPEYLRTMPHLRPRTPVNAVLLRLRSEAIASLTQFFAGRSFTQTHPPILTSSDCEGAGEVFTVTPANDTSDAADNGGSQESFFRSRKYLTVSTQLHLEALAQAVGNVWTLSPVFRAEKSETSRHLSEFYMLEAEMSFVDDLGPVMDLAEDMLRSLSTSLIDSATVQDLLFRSRHSGSDLAPADEVRRRWEGLARKDWPRITYSDAVALLQQRADRFEHKPTWGAGLQSEHEKYLAEHVGGGEKPVFVTHYPRDIKAFYMRETQPATPDVPGATVDCFDLLVPEFCEIAGGSMRENRLEPLLEIMKRQGILKPPASEGPADPNQPSSAGGLEWYVDLRRWGCPPHGGFGIGFDRLLSYLAGVQTVRDIVSFPRWYGRCDC
jgi:asparaginyl-tRNA synthetase